MNKEKTRELKDENVFINKIFSFIFINKLSESNRPIAPLTD